MGSLLPVILGAIAVLAAVWLAGKALAPKLPSCYTFGLGAILVSYAVFALMTVHGAGRRWLFAVLLLCIAAGLRQRPNVHVSWPPFPALLVGIPFSIWYLVNSLAPEVQADPNTYHLQPAIDSLRHGGFSSAISFYDRLPHAIEMLFVPAWRIGGSSAAKLVHLGFLFATLPLIVRIARVLQLPEVAGYGAAMLYFCVPIVGFAGVAAFNDAALVYFTLAAVGLALEDHPWAAGLCAGFCYAVKMTGGLTIPVAAALFLWRKQWRAAIIVCLAAFLTASPWAFRNWMQTGNPAAPFLNAWFPNPYFYVMTERNLSANLRDYGVPFWQRFSEVLTGHRLHGILGPAFALAPVALLAVRRRNGVLLLTLAAVFSIAWWMNAGARFAMPMLPFLALAMCAALPGKLVPVLVAAHAVSSWPMLISQYGYASLHLRDLPIRAALRLESEHEYLKRIDDYRYVQLVNDNTPPNARILDMVGVHAAFSNRELLGYWRSAEAVRLVEGLGFARPSEDAKLVGFRGDFSAQNLCGVRVTRASAMNSVWNIHSIELRLKGERVKIGSNWYASSSKLPWETRFAFDRNPVSRWTTGQPAQPGDFVQVDFAERADALRLLLPAGTRPDDIRAETCTAGQWQPLDLQETPAPELDLRPAAVALLKQAGITHVLAPADYEGIGALGERLINTAEHWNLEVVANLHTITLLKVR